MGAAGGIVDEFDDVVVGVVDVDALGAVAVFVDGACHARSAAS